MLDVLTFLPDQVLAKVDRAAMRVSLETRVPMLDHRLAEFVWSLPASYRANAKDPKRILRQILSRYVPTELTERPKKGFGVPISDWLRGPLRAWAEDLLSEQTLAQEGYLNPVPIRRAWGALLLGDDLGHHLWAVLNFQAWLRARLGGSAIA